MYIPKHRIIKLLFKKILFCRKIAEKLLLRKIRKKEKLLKKNSKKH